MRLMDWFAFQRLTKVILSIWLYPTQGRRRRRLRHRHPQQLHPISTIRLQHLLQLVPLLLPPPPPTLPPTTTTTATAAIKRTLILSSPDSVGFLDWMELAAMISLDVVVLVP